MYIKTRYNLYNYKMKSINKEYITKTDIFEWLLAIEIPIISAITPIPITTKAFFQEDQKS